MDGDGSKELLDEVVWLWYDFFAWVLSKGDDMRNRILIAVVFCLMLSVQIVYAQNLRILVGSLSGGDMSVTLKSSVSYDNTTNLYLYEYEIKNTGSRLFLFQWKLLDKALSGRFNFPHIFEMEPGKEYKFVLRSEEAPAIISEHAGLFRKNDPTNSGYKDMLSRENVTASNYDLWLLSPGGAMSGYLPPSYLKKLGEK